jgi:hypothetical protein
VILLAVALSLGVPCYAIEMPRFLKGLTTSRNSDVAPPPPSQTVDTPGGAAPTERPTQRSTRTETAGRGVSSGAGDLHIQEIQKGTSKASVVFDKHCAHIVQPYRLADNVASVGAFALTEGIKNLPSYFSGRSAPVKDADLSASTKVAAKQMNWLPMSAEVLYGERAHSQETDVLDRESKLGRRYYPVADKMLKDILSKINERHEYEFNLYILKSSKRNALARPGGFIYVDQGLIDDAAQHPKAYFALAHEIAHVLQRHETKELQSMVVDSIQTKQELRKVMSGVGRDPTLILSRVHVQKNLFTQHHIDQELQADSCATRMLSRAFPDSRALAESLQAFLRDLPKVGENKQSRQQPRNDVEKLAALAHGVVNDPIRRHPTTQQRYDNLRAMYSEIVGRMARQR